jgi:two-component system chemotaxis response regulator CheB
MSIPTKPRIRVMMVDDSSVIRGMVTRVLEAANIEVVATAASPAAALTILKRPAPHKTEVDILILDVQLSGKGDASIIKEFRKIDPAIHIIIAATLNETNVLNSIDALEQGADELVAKPSSRKAPGETESFVRELLTKVKKLAGIAEEYVAAPDIKLTAPATTFQPEHEIHCALRPAPAFFRPKALAIASSTGGPKALQILFEGLRKRVGDIPIFITQHMPKDFTASLASQLGKVSGLPSGEGKEGEVALAGHIYLAPGDYHMLVQKHGAQSVIRLNQGEQENFCRPAADPMLRSLYSIYGKDLLVVVLTGMGQDGLLGAKMIAENGGMVIEQDKASSVVWGMPGAVAKEGICTQILPVSQLADAIVKICNEPAV